MKYFIYACVALEIKSFHSIHPIFKKDLLDSARIAGNLWSMILVRIFLTIHIFLRAFRFENLLLKTHGLFTLSCALLPTTSTILGYDNHCPACQFGHHCKWIWSCLVSIEGSTTIDPLPPKNIARLGGFMGGWFWSIENINGFWKSGYQTTTILDLLHG